MKYTKRLGRIAGMLALAFLAALALGGCGNILHNGTEMDLAKLTVTGLPANPFAEGQTMIFSYDTGNGWIHDSGTLFADPTYAAKVTNGSLTYTFNPPLVIKTPVLQFLFIDPGKNWQTLQLDNSWGAAAAFNNVNFTNIWKGASDPVTITGTVSGASLTWTLQDLNGSVWAEK
ncbi:MAG TPA: hypothetical protein VMV83_13370 [Rectinemataceae bacterium]|nr:hypothetical protein [Rectinemataceae bacterium]